MQISNDTQTHHKADPAIDEQTEPIYRYSYHPETNTMNSKVNKQTYKDLNVTSHEH